LLTAGITESFVIEPNWKIIILKEARMLVRLKIFNDKIVPDLKEVIKMIEKINSEE
jgi:hypothetical protein